MSEAWFWTVIAATIAAVSMCAWLLYKEWKDSS